MIPYDTPSFEIYNTTPQLYHISVVRGWVRVFIPLHIGFIFNKQTFTPNNYNYRNKIHAALKKRMPTQSRLDCILRVILAALINDIADESRRVARRHLLPPRNARGEGQGEGSLPISRIALDDGNLSESYVRLPKPAQRFLGNFVKRVDF